MFIFKDGEKWISSKIKVPNYRFFILRNNIHVFIYDHSKEEHYASIAIYRLKYPADFSSKLQVIFVTDN